ncbi:hypothetical protein BDN72DRAFT_966385 [Pluteus cervinus]|uniref:Uncharacterized protein n=1 Tax=Pluteus cervinus TaxID=181527 RepID=A0ACD2ZY66_9AGAR|nr:hypothetical protein BDN72DRAFT_966385 [Pluteus cervinus]
MADIERAPKYGFEWTVDDLKAYNIGIDVVDESTFFGAAGSGAAVPSIDGVLDKNPNIPASIVENTKEPEQMEYEDHATRQFFQFLGNLNAGTADDTKYADEFGVFLLNLMNYNTEGREIHTKKEIEYISCGEQKKALVDVCMTDMQPVEDYVRFLQVNKKSSKDLSDVAIHAASASLIAGAVAAFSLNHRLLQSASSRPDGIVFPGLTVIGSVPIFFKIPVTQDLVMAVNTGHYPSEPTNVQIIIPTAAVTEETGKVKLQLDLSDLEMRRNAFRYLEAMKTFL